MCSSDLFPSHDICDPKLKEQSIELSSVIDTKIEKIRSEFNSQIKRINVRLDIMNSAIETFRSQMEDGFKTLREDLYTDLGALMHISILPHLDDHTSKIKELRAEFNGFRNSKSQ